MRRDRFTFLQSYKTALDWLDKNERLDYLLAIINYALEGKEPALQGATRACFELIRPIIDNGAKLSETAKENGAKGGAPIGNQNARKQPKTTEKQPKTTENKLEREREMEREMEREGNNAHPRARERFCEAYGIAADAEPPPDMDFDKLTLAYSQSSLLQDPDKKHFRKMSWIVKNYDKITDGVTFVDFGKRNNFPRVTSDYSADELNAVFEKLNEEL